MSDDDHHFESKADAGASETYPQQVVTICKNGYIVIKNHPSKVVEVSTSKIGKHGHAKCHFVGIDIFNGKKLEDIIPSSHICDDLLLEANNWTAFLDFWVELSYPIGPPKSPSEVKTKMANEQGPSDPLHLSVLPLEVESKIEFQGLQYRVQPRVVSLNWNLMQWV